MSKLFGIPVGSLAEVLAVVLLLLLGVVVVLALRNRVFFRLGVRNASRRRGRAALIVVGLMLATVIFTASLATGDTMSQSIRSSAIAALGRTDEVVGAKGLTASLAVGTAGTGTPYFPRNYADRIAAAGRASGLVRAVAPVIVWGAAVQDLSSGQYEPKVTLFAGDPASLAAFGPMRAGGKTVSLAQLGPNEVYLNTKGANALGAKPGDSVRVLTGNGVERARVKAVVSYAGAATADYGVLMPLERAQALLGKPGLIDGVYVANRGGVAATDRVVKALQPTVSALGLETDKTRQDALTAADAAGAAFVSFFTTFGSFSIAAGILLIFLIFVMLAAERRSELGVARAVGTRRGHLVQMFVYEGATYDLVAALVGAALGVLVAFGMVFALGGVFASTPNFHLAFAVKPASLVVAYTMGVLLTLAVLAFSASRVSRMNIVSAIRDLPDPAVRRGGRRRWVATIALIALGALMAVSGISAKNGITLGLGVSLLIFGLDRLLRALGLNERAVRTGAGLALMAWFVFPISDWLFGRMSVNFSIFVLGGLMIVIGATWTIMYNADILLGTLGTTLGRVKRIAPIVRMSIAYPLRSLFRTGVTLAMFMLVVFVLVVGATTTGAFTNAYNNIRTFGGGFDVHATASAGAPVLDMQAAVRRSPALSPLISVVASQIDAARQGTPTRNHRQAGELPRRRPRPELPHPHQLRLQHLGARLQLTRRRLARARDPPRARGRRPVRRPAPVELRLRRRHHELQAPRLLRRRQALGARARLRARPADRQAHDADRDRRPRRQRPRRDGRHLDLAGHPHPDLRRPRAPDHLPVQAQPGRRPDSDREEAPDRLHGQRAPSRLDEEAARRGDLLEPGLRPPARRLPRARADRRRRRARGRHRPRRRRAAPADRRPARDRLPTPHGPGQPSDRVLLHRAHRHRRRHRPRPHRRLQRHPLLRHDRRRLGDEPELHRSLAHPGRRLPRRLPGRARNHAHPRPPGRARLPSRSTPLPVARRRQKGAVMATQQITNKRLPVGASVAGVLGAVRAGALSAVRARPMIRVSAVVGIAGLSGLLIGLVMPRGPVTSGQALALLEVAIVVGFTSGLLLRSRWALLLAPAVQIGVFELVRLGASGPTVDGISTDGMFGVLAFIVGRGFYGLIGVLPMLVAAAYGAGLARRLASPQGQQRRLRSRIALYFRRGVTAVAAVAVVGLVWLLAQPASVPPIRDASGTVVPGSIASLEKVQINGSEQWIEIRAWSPDKPVLLSIPGGPGQSDLALSRPTLGTLAKDFVVVSWDQRGIGKSYASFDPTKLTTKQEVADTIALTNYLRKRFNEPKIYLFGESGGSVIGVLAVQQHPELYHAWIGSGQMVNPRETDRRIYHDLLAYAAKHHDTGLANKLHGYGEPPYSSVYAYGYVMTQYDKLAGDYTEPKAYTDALDNAGVGPFGVMGSEYTLPEKMNVLRGLLDTFSVIYPQWQTIDFQRTAEQLRVPVYIFTGAHELAARRDLAVAWFNHLHAPIKRLYNYPDAGHATAFEHFQDLHHIMLKTVVPATYTN